MLNTGIALLIAGVVGGFSSLLIALLNMKKLFSTKSREVGNIQKGFGNHIFCMIGMLCSIGTFIVGLVLVGVHFLGKYIN